MELDKRIEALTDILSVTVGCHDWELMTKKGFFANSIFDFRDLKRLCAYGEYAGWREHNQCFLCKQAGDETYYSYFLPESRLLPEEKPEKKYRAFSLNEFSGLYAIGDVVTFRVKDCEVIEQSMLIGFLSSDDEDAAGNGCVIIGNCRYGLKELFNDYELQYLDHWQPFGITDEDKE